jgi:trehalose utilization protein
VRCCGLDQAGEPPFLSQQAQEQQQQHGIGPPVLLRAHVFCWFGGEGRGGRVSAAAVQRRRQWEVGRRVLSNGSLLLLLLLCRFCSLQQR